MFWGTRLWLLAVTCVSITWSNQIYLRYIFGKLQQQHNLAVQKVVIHYVNTPQNPQSHHFFNLFHTKTEVSSRESAGQVRAEKLVMIYTSIKVISFHNLHNTTKTIWILYLIVSLCPQEEEVSAANQLIIDFCKTPFATKSKFIYRDSKQRCDVTSLVLYWAQ